MKVKAELAQKGREGLDEECDQFCAGMYFTYSMCVPDMDSCMKNMKDLSDLRG